jgi:peptidoglycan/LPS O-acetylase OafA/YrhL
MESKTLPRRHDLDWLRVLAILAVFTYHSAMIFAPDPFSIKNRTTYQFIDDLGEFAGLWGMPLILLISGGSAFYALGKAGPAKYVKGLIARLLVPLAVGIFTHCAFQVYLENLHKGTFSGSFFDFYPRYFDGLYGLGGNFAWMGMHLWYLEALFIFSLLLLPLFLWFGENTRGQALLERLGNFLARPGAASLFALPAIVLINLLDPDTWGTSVFGGWSVFIYLTFFASGFVIASSERLQASIARWRWMFLAAGILLWPLFEAAWDALGDPAFGTWGFALGTMLYCLCPWWTLLAILGFGSRHLNISTPFLKYANEAVLPFYILHQPVVITAGYFVVQWSIPDLLKWAVVLVAAFAITLGLYEFGVRRYNVTRVLFGMKPVRRQTSAQPQEAQVHGTAQTV